MIIILIDELSIVCSTRFNWTVTTVPSIHNNKAIELLKPIEIYNSIRAIYCIYKKNVNNISTKPSPINKPTPISKALSILDSNNSDLIIWSADLFSLQSLSDLYNKAKLSSWQYKNVD